MLLLLQAGILAADKVLTVSPNYASEIGSGPDKGVELDSVIRMVSRRRITTYDYFLGPQRALSERGCCSQCSLGVKMCQMQPM
jgi:hypothetical protein